MKTEAEKRLEAVLAVIAEIPQQIPLELDQHYRVRLKEWTQRVRDAAAAEQKSQTQGE